MIVAYCPLLYGKAYLKQAVDAVAPFADKILILYTRQPSFGYGTDLKCPDSEEELRACVEHLSPGQLQWHTGQWPSEGEHRSTVLKLLPHAELILPFDSDEIWYQVDLHHCIAEARKSAARNFQISGFVHFWRSFGWVCEDVWAPVRIIKPRGNGNATLAGRVFHFGYAIAEAMMRYKWSIHGHKVELRPRWMEDVFLANRRTDCHPTTLNWWNARRLDPRNLPMSLQEHPNCWKELVQ